MNAPVIVRIQFTDPERGSMDVENALDAFETPAALDFFEADIAEAIGVLRNCNHPNAATVADKLFRIINP
jgi:hypothetical protein